MSGFLVEDKMKNKSANTTRTSNFKLAAYLLSNGHKLISIEPTDNRRRKAFVLEGEDTEQLTSSFYEDKKLKRVFEAERELKERLYNEF